MGYTAILKTNLGTADRTPNNNVAMDVQEEDWRRELEAVVV
jgi:hypothetical protein